MIYAMRSIPNSSSFRRYLIAKIGSRRPKIQKKSITIMYVWIEQRWVHRMWFLTPFLLVTSPSYLLISLLVKKRIIPAQPSWNWLMNSITINQNKLIIQLMNISKDPSRNQFLSILNVLVCSIFVVQSIIIINTILYIHL